MNNKLKLLIVDDELLSRKRICAFDLSDSDLQIIGEAENGSDALNKIDILKPDIVVTDIVMPVIDGLQLLELIQKMPYPPKVVMLTCYDDFDKVQTALRLGAQDYIIKVMLHETDFKKSITKVAEAIKRERQEKYESIRNLFGKLLKAHSDSAAQHYLQQLESVGFRFTFLRLIHILTSDAGLPLLYQQKDSLEVWSGPIRCMCLDEDKCETLVLYSTDIQDIRNFSDRSMEYIAMLQAALEKNAGMCDPIVVGMAQQAGVLPYTALESLLRYEEAFFYPGSIPTLNMETPHRKEYGSFPQDTFMEALESFRKGFDEWNFAGAIESVSGWVMEVESRKPRPETVLAMARTFASCIPEPLSSNRMENGIPVSEFLEYRINGAKSVACIAEGFEEAISSLCKTSVITPKVMRTEIRKALEYITRNYAEDITLQSAAQYVRLSESWFSTLFRSEVRQSFSDYLIEFRIEKAKRLLVQSDLSVNQVSTSVGIMDPHYFSRLFTKAAGINPKEYRKGSRPQERAAYAGKM